MANAGNEDFIEHLRGLFGELKRRKVYRVAIVYLVGAVAGLELMDALVPASRLPDWSDEMFLGLAIFGFPLVVILAWAFEVTPEGLRLTEPAKPASPRGTHWHRIGLALLICAAVAAWVYLTRDANLVSDSKEVATTRVNDTTAAAETREALRPDRPFVAVLPLENLSPDEENAYFAAGMHEEILSQLSKLSSLGVFARTTMNQYRGKELSISQIGQDLGAALVLEGSVRRAGNRVRITAQLIDPQTQESLWAESFDRKLDDVFAVQEEIARQVVVSLAGTLSPSEDARITHRPTESLAAYDHFLRGREALRQATYEKNREAERLFRQALEIDAKYALAWAGLGWTYAQRDGRLGYPHGPPAEQAVEYARRAIGLDGQLSEAHEALGSALRKLGRQEEALAAFHAALRYEPNSAEAASGVAVIYYSIGQYDHSVRYAKRAARLEPDRIGLLSLVAHVYKFLRMDDQAMRWLDKQLELDPNHYWPRLLQAQYDTYHGHCESALERVQALVRDLADEPYAWTGAAGHAYMCRDFAQAAAWAQRSLELAPDNIAGYWHETPTLLALALRYSDDSPAGMALFAQTLENVQARVASGERFWNILWDLAALQAANGDAEKAIDTLEHAYREGYRFVRWPGFETAFDGIRNHPRYVRLMGQMEADVTAMRERVIREEQG